MERCSMSVAPFFTRHIVKALEEMTENIPHDHLEKLAHHAFQGELWDKAVIYLKRCRRQSDVEFGLFSGFIQLPTGVPSLRTLT